MATKHDTTATPEVVEYTTEDGLKAWGCPHSPGAVAAKERESGQDTPDETKEEAPTSDTAKADGEDTAKATGENGAAKKPTSGKTPAGKA